MTRRVVLLALAAACLGLVPVLRDDLGRAPSFLPASLAAVVLCDLLTCALLAQQFLSRGGARLLLLAGTYLFCALAVVAHGLAFPGVATASGLLGGDAATPTWLWALWHAALPAGLALAMWGGPRATRRRLAAPDLRRGRTLATWLLGTAAAAVALTWLLVAARGVLPQVVAGDEYQRAARAVGPWVAAVNVLALLVVARRGRRGELEPWLLVVAAASLADVVLTLAAGERWTAGWYGARMLSVVASATVLVALVAEVGRLYRSLRHDVTHDGLTGVRNRASALLLAEDRHRSRPAGEPLAVALVDVDHLGDVNDRFGRLAGDAVLQAVAACLVDAVRDEDVVGRYGGEEFVLVLPGTGLDGARLALDRALAAVRDAPMGTWAHDLHVTVSAGLALVGPGERAVDLALVEAEEALARAKRAGRDRLVAAGEVSAAPEPLRPPAAARPRPA